MISKGLITRPVLAHVLAVLLVLIGAWALFGLPVVLHPNRAPPTVQVTTRYPGASPATLVAAVARPIEQQVNGVPNMLYMQSTSTGDGTYTLTVTFAIGTNPAEAQMLVRDRVATAQPLLPGAVQAQGVTVEQSSTAIMMFVALQSPDRSHDSAYLDNFATNSLVGALARLPGIGKLRIFGAAQAFSIDGQPAAGIAIFQSQEADALAVASAVRARLAELAKSFPPGLSTSIPFDATGFVRASIDAMNTALFEAGILVLAVLVVVLQDWRASLVAATAMAVVLVGATAAAAAQFTLLMAATVLISAISAAWPCRPVPPAQRNRFYRDVNAAHDALERRYLGLVTRMVDHPRLLGGLALLLMCVAALGLSRLPAGFLPAEDQGYVMVAAELAEGASLGQTQRVLAQITEAVRKVPGVERVVAIAGISAPDNNASAANAGVAYVILKDRSQRAGLTQALDGIADANSVLLDPPAIPGLGNSGGFTMQVELRDGSFDYAKLRTLTRAILAGARAQSGLARLSSSMQSAIGQYNLYPSTTVLGAPAPGFSSGQAMDLMDQVAKHTMPAGTGYDWSAISYQEAASSHQTYGAFGVAILLVYLLLARRYESWWAPIPVLLAMPLALPGPVATLNALRLDNTLYVKLGLCLLLALAARNAILIVEAARARRKQGLLGRQAAIQASQACFRPILMTAFAVAASVLPLVFAQGAGAAARAAIGITVFSGMIASTGLVLLFVPVFVVLVQASEARLGGVYQPGSIRLRTPSRHT